ncbi:unnamed protein product [Lactuca saligna]|uniref:HMA domain-containing protein n=1 Tax=Lactuca saligna TaxID=75948 RepID=A0AA35VRM0_LACSI|nr:unnamed protein product [Lactuca saligna]
MVTRRRVTPHNGGLGRCSGVMRPLWALSPQCNRYIDSSFAAMAPEKVTEMVLNVDLKCSGCYKKVKKVICKIPQIRDQVFDVDKNKVKLIVVCCSPEAIRDKLCYKGGGAIQSIEIVEKSEKPKETEKAKPAAVADKPKEAEKAKPPADKPKDAKPAADKPAGKPKEAEKPKAADKPKDQQEKPKAADKPKDAGKPPEAKPKDAGKPPEAKPKDAGKPPEAKPKDGGKPPEGKPKEAEKPKQEAPKKVDFAPNPEVAKMVYEPVHGYPQMYPQSAYPPMVGYGQYYDQGYGGAPFQHGYGMPIAPPPPPPSYGGFGYDHGGYNNGYNGNRSHYSSNDYGGEEEGEGCSIM